MTDEIRIWAMDGTSHEAEPVSPTDRVEREDYLENVLVKNPDMLMPGLKLVGRQTPTDSGNLDLLGVDEYGRLVVFELKRGKLTREAVAQAIDYSSYLESLSEADWLRTSPNTHVEKRELKQGEEWYGEQRRVRPTLVGLDGADAGGSAWSASSGKRSWTSLS